LVTSHETLKHGMSSGKVPFSDSFMRKDEATEREHLDEIVQAELVPTASRPGEKARPRTSSVARNTKAHCLT
jgi:hypothetical protein